MPGERRETMTLRKRRSGRHLLPLPRRDHGRDPPRVGTLRDQSSMRGEERRKPIGPGRPFDRERERGGQARLSRDSNLYKLREDIVYLHRYPSFPLSSSV
jgi:hypothetical protein